MTMEHFTIWLSGYLEGKDRGLTPEETKVINDKLNSCFNKITPLVFNSPLPMDTPPITTGIINKRYETQIGFPSTQPITYLGGHTC